MKPTKSYCGSHSHVSDRIFARGPIRWPQLNLPSASIHRSKILHALPLPGTRSPGFIFPDFSNSNIRCHTRRFSFHSVTSCAIASPTSPINDPRFRGYPDRNSDRAGLRHRYPCPAIRRRRLWPALSVLCPSHLAGPLHRSMYRRPADAHGPCHRRHRRSCRQQVSRVLGPFAGQLRWPTAVRPRAFAAATPAFVRSRMMPRSNSAMDPKMLNTSFPPGVLVSMCSR